VLRLGEKLVSERSLEESAPYSIPATLSCVSSTNLESSSEAENTVIGLLLRETLEGKKNGLGFLGDQIIGSADTTYQHLFHLYTQIALPSIDSVELRAGVASRCAYLKPSFL
tara:strand:- start:380 stop:715 length:336 start_codon:yes stop_codon:yes gene_type:complete